ncbi:MAG TPA: D-2-hydroxyacid dehydrogenase family protein [Chloroflexia bacterium]|nr:D-2-hydroxyacid dehydrogenase family protein [Chloroflexia bacterium]
MRIVIPDDYQDVIRSLNAFSKLEGHEVTVYHDTSKDLEKLVERFQEADALVLTRERTKITEELLARLPKLKLISQTGRGTPHIDLEACTRHGVAVATGGGASSSTAELTWALVLAAARHLPQEVAALKAGKWQISIGFSLKGRTLGIFGFGKIGSLVAEYGRVFGMKVLVWGREGSLSRASAAGFEAAASKNELFEKSDVLSLHLQMREETHGIVKAADLALMKPTAVLVNTSRAGLIESGALVAALKAGRPGYAAVDVYEDEPVIDHPLLHMDNVICTPHLGYVEKDNYEQLFGAAFDQLLAYAAGNPINLINPEVLK